MHQNVRLMGAALFAALLAACASNGAGTPLPATDAQSGTISGAPPGALPAATSPPSSDPAAASQLSTQALQTASTTSTSGSIAGLRTGGGLTLNEGSAVGYVPVTYTSATVVNSYGGSVATGHYALVMGTGSVHTGFTAQYVAGFTSSPAVVSLTGTLYAMASYGFEIKTAAHGITPVVTTATTKISGSPAVGGTVTVTGPGSASAAIFATSISASGTTTSGATPPPVTSTSTTMKHVLTADYLGSPWGTTGVSASRAAPVLSWASTGVGNTNTFAASGIKTEVYFNANRTETQDPLYKQAESSFYHNCSNARIHDYFDGVTQYLMNNASPTMRANYASYVASQTSGYHVDAIFEDDAVPPGTYPTGFFAPGSPCSYNTSTWLADERAMQAGLNHNTIINGLNRLNGHTVSLAVGELTNSKTIGGNYESCFIDSANNKEGVWVWQAAEDTQLQVTRAGKYFQCMVLDKTSAPSASSSRIYALASFLLTYNPTYSILWESYYTPSGLHVMPESQLVPTSPLVSTPSTSASLKNSTGVYVREYRTCYYAGRSIGQCAMVVNNDYYTHSTPHFSQIYHHTLTVSGYGQLDGGTVGFTGGAPPTSMASETAFIAVP